MHPHSSQWAVGARNIETRFLRVLGMHLLSPLLFLHVCVGLPAGPGRGGTMAAAAASLRSDSTERPERPATPRLPICALCFGKIFHRNSLC